PPQKVFNAVEPRSSEVRNDVILTLLDHDIERATSRSIARIKMATQLTRLPHLPETENPAVWRFLSNLTGVTSDAKQTI
ncbi:MAG: hypothetical protein OSA42_06225, partial [Porticoccaceae bacterium]|nr:hypothetical protein [Porticoccaceae bacterium]